MRPYNFQSVPLTISPPILFQFRQTANLIAGEYEWNTTKIALTPDRSVNATAMYWFRTITASADIAEADYAGAIVSAADIPQLSLYLLQQGAGPFFREPIQIGKYLMNLPYEFACDPTTDPNKFLGALTGKLTQTRALLGKTSITITVIWAAQEIMDENFNTSLKAGYGSRH